MKNPNVSRKAYTDALKSIRRQLPWYHRLMSTVTHAPVLSQISAFFALFAARPRPLTYGAIAAAAGTALIYATAKYYGYTLSGSESIIFFGIGWTIGMITDYATFLFYGSSKE